MTAAPEVRPWAPPDTVPASVRKANHDLIRLARIAQASDTAQKQSKGYSDAHGTPGSYQNARQALEQVDATIVETQSRIQQLKADLIHPSSQPHIQPLSINTQKASDAPKGSAAARPGWTSSLGHVPTPVLSSRRVVLEKKIDMYRSDSKALAQLRATVKEHEEVWDQCSLHA
jgi:hypothetical protein